MSIIQSECRRVLWRCLATPVALLALLAPWGYSGALAASLPRMFSGVTGLEARLEVKTATQILEFKSDLPFQYQMQVLDKNHVVFRLYNARLTSNLLTTGGGVNLLSGGSVSDARLHPLMDRQSKDVYQEILLTGPNLGLRTFKVLGATPLPVKATLLPSSAVKSVKPANKALDRFAAKPIPSGHPVKLAGKPASKKLPNLAALQQQGAALQAPVLPVRAVALMALARPERVEERSSTESGSLWRMAAQPATSEVQASSTEPERQPLMVLPSYQGGAPPIQGMTLDASGHPVRIRPKNTPIPEFDVNDRNGGYNVLFQAETPELNSPDRVDALMNEALSWYRKQQYPQAEQAIQRALKLADANADLYAALAEIQLKQKNSQAAMQSYQQASRLLPEQYGQPYAQVLVQAGKRQDAIQVLERLNQAYPRQEQIVYMLGTLHEELGDVDRALSYLKQAAQLRPASVDIQYNLGLAYELSGDREQAETHYRAALTLSPKAVDVVNALERVRQ